MTRVVLIRHGQTEWNKSGRYQGQSNVPLSERGKLQAKILAERFPLPSVDVIYTSDLCRARETAEEVGRHFNVPVHPDSHFRELSFGDWEGLTYDQIVAEWPDAIETFFKRPDELQIPHGETFQQVQSRALGRLEELLKEHEGKTIVITAHGAVLRSVIAGVLHMPLRYVWTIRQFNTAVSILRFDPGVYPSIELLNSVEHLPRALR